MNPVEWRTSSFSGGGGNNCVELALGPAQTRIRDTKARTNGTLTVASATFASFVAVIKSDDAAERGDHRNL